MLRLAILLPLPALRTLGRVSGRLYQILGRRRARIARINVDLCFPELSDAERAALVRRHFEAVGIGVFELGLAWWASDRRLRRITTWHGLEHLRTAHAQGKGVILLSAHFTTLDFSGRLISMCDDMPPIKGLYRPNENPVVERFIRGNRERHFDALILREDIRSMLRALKAGEVVWYAPDQNFGHKGSVFAPFFGVPAATNTATTRLASLSGAAVMPFFTRRRPDGHYEQTIFPPLEDFPGPDPETDTARINAVFEDWIRQAPEQYFWTHRRFKDRPNDGPRFY
jgi:Kdo2-lipid IVA lauroyltransferase/acyltransferase